MWIVKTFSLRFLSFDVLGSWFGSPEVIPVKKRSVWTCQNQQDYMKLNYFLLLKAVNWKKMNSKPNRIDPSYRPRGVSWPECKKNAFYTLNDTFNKQKVQYITWQYGLHMLMVSSSTVAQHTNCIKSNTCDREEKKSKRKTHTIQFGIQEDEIEENKTLK